MDDAAEPVAIQFLLRRDSADVIAQFQSHQVEAPRTARIISIPVPIQFWTRFQSGSMEFPLQERFAAPSAGAATSSETESLFDPYSNPTPETAVREKN